MSLGLYSGVSGLALGIGLYRNTSGLWSGASGLVTGWGGASSAALDIDFTTGVLDPRITFFRGSNATLIDSTGVITFAPNNLVLRSEEFDNAYWSKSGSSVSANAAIAPNGTTTADKFVEDTGNSAHAIIVSGGLSQTSVISLYAKASERSIIGIGNGTDAQYAQFDLSNGTIISGSTGSISGGAISSVGDGWYRISCLFTHSGTTKTLAFTIYQSSGVRVYTGDGTSGLFIWGAQLEAVTYQTTPSAYNATTSAAYYGPRFDYNPNTLFPRGLLLEGARTNLLLNSSIGGTSLATQSVTVAAVPYTLSFYGTGQIVLSGTSSGTIVGTGAYPGRRTYTFTPTAGTLTLTVTGTVQYAQLEAGTWASSFIPTGSTAVTRDADSAAMIGDNFSSWYTNTAGTFAIGAETGFGTTTQNPSALLITDALGINYQALYVNGTTRGISYTGWYSDFNLDFISQSYDFTSLPTRQYDLTSDYAFFQTIYGQAVAYEANDFADSGNGVAPSLDTSGIVPVYMSRMAIGPNDNTVGYGGWFGWIRTLKYYGSRLDNSSLRVLSEAASVSPATLELNFLQQQYYVGAVPYGTPAALTTDFISQTYVVG